MSKSAQSKRLERAKQQYESLLMNAGDIHLNDSNTTQNIRGYTSTIEEINSSNYSSTSHGNQRDGNQTSLNSFPFRNPGNLVASTQRLLSSPQVHTLDPGDWNEPSVGSTSNRRHSHSDEFPSGESQAIIISLQDEIERLKDKLNTVIANAQETFREIQESQVILADQNATKEITLERKVESLTLENNILREACLKAQREVDIERTELKKALRFFERLKNINPGKVPRNILSASTSYENKQN